MKSSASEPGLSELNPELYVWIVQHALSVCFRRIERLKIVFETNVDLHIRRTKVINKNLYDNVYLALFGRKFIKIAGSLYYWFDAS